MPAHLVEKILMCGQILVELGTSSRAPKVLQSTVPGTPRRQLTSTTNQISNLKTCYYGIEPSFLLFVLFMMQSSLGINLRARIYM